MPHRIPGLLVLTLWAVMAGSVHADVTVSSVTELVNAVDSANHGGDKTILVADGVYNMSGRALYIIADGVTVRGASGKWKAVVLDSHYVESGTSGVFRIVSSDVTIAHLTLRYQYYHAIHISASSRTIRNVHIRNVHVIDAGEQAIKINADRLNGANYRVRSGSITGCLIELTDRGRTNLTNGGYPCYTGGIDAHWAVNWEIRDNVIRGFWCADGLSEHGIHMWNHSDNALVERNQIINCDRGIGFGLGIDHGNQGGTIRNNMIFHGPNTGFSDVGIGLESTPGARVYNNTIFHKHGYSAIEYRFIATAGVLITNNLTNRAITVRDSASGNVTNNFTTAKNAWFADVDRGDLHLLGHIGDVVGQGRAISGLSDDFDQERRPQGDGYELGADEISSAPSVPVKDLNWMWLLLEDE